MAKTVTIDFHPYPHQKEVLEYEARFKALMWPIRSGKDYYSVAETVKITVEEMEKWSQRTDMTPRWHIWGIGPTFPLTKQLWRDIKRIVPNELMAKPPRENDMTIPLIHDGLIEMKSADEPDRLVASAIDLVLGTECGLWKREVWSKSVRGRLSSPGRLGRAILNGTPQGQIDPSDPTQLHWWWQMILQGQNPDNWKRLHSFYWFEDKLKYGNLDHPIHSRTKEGLAELQSVIDDPDISERYYRQNYLGECLPATAGKPITPQFDLSLHVFEFDYMPGWDVTVSLDFGRHYPVATIHQMSPDNIWHVLGEFAPINQDLTDEEFIGHLQLYVKELCPDVKIVHYLGDHEAHQKQDARYESTAMMMRRKYGINFVSQPTKTGDEQLAIDVLNGRLRTRNDQKTGLVIHPRCSFSVKCFQGGWYFKMGKTRDYSWTEERVAEVHPFIDAFDTYKYFVTHVIQPKEHREVKYKDEDNYDYSEPIRVDADTGIPL